MKVSQFEAWSGNRSRMRGRWMRGTRMRMHGGDNEDKDDGDDEEEEEEDGGGSDDGDVYYYDTLIIA